MYYFLTHLRKTNPTLLPSTAKRDGRYIICSGRISITGTDVEIMDEMKQLYVR